jgi:hypothetical protein
MTSTQGAASYATFSLPSVEVDDNEILKFHTMITRWITSIYNDKYATPHSICGKKVKELNQYISSKSQELSSIRVQQIQSRYSNWQTIRRILYFLTETLCTSVLTFTVMYMIYSTVSTISVESDTVALPVYAYDINATFIERAKQYTYVTYASLPTINSILNQGGAIMGNMLYATGQFGVTLVDNAAGTPHFIRKVYAALFSMLVGFFIYRIVQPFTSVIHRARVATTKYEQLLILQNEFVKEYENTINQSLYHLFSMNIMSVLEQLLFASSKGSSQEAKRHIMCIINIYSADYAILYHAIITPYEKQIRSMDTADILRVSQPTPLFINLMFRIIRESGDELAQQFMLLNQSMLEVPQGMRNAIITPVRNMANSIPYISPVISFINAQRNMGS